MTSRDIRQSFLDFFKSKDHRIVPSAPVIPHGDATLLFTNAGMNQFKDVFLGTGTRDYKRAADTQKCIRVSGKHNDLEEVGHDTYHHTFFEMLGNWSFGDYYKREAIAWAWELLTGVWGLEKKRMHATVFRTDDEAFQLWKEVTDIDPTHIHRFDEKDNFWEMGETGPCGPCSEIHYDKTPDYSGAPLVNAGDPRVMEIWNLVFIQYNRDASGKLTELPAKHVDTGMGFERVCAVLQGKDSNYDTDVFTPVIEKIESLSLKRYTTQIDDRDSIAMRVMADHVRAVSFSIADGSMPSNEGRGYVLRRLLRRAARYARNLDIHDPILFKLVPTLVETMGDVFPELRDQERQVERVIKAEEEAFGATLENGIIEFNKITFYIISESILHRDFTQSEVRYLNAMLSSELESETVYRRKITLSELTNQWLFPPDNPELKEKLFAFIRSKNLDPKQISLSSICNNIYGERLQIPGIHVFKLYDTFGFPLDLTELMARERGFTIDREGFDRLLQEQKQRSRDARKAHHQEVELPTVSAATPFTGYDGTQTEAKVLFAKENQIVLDRTPFYSEAGGQISDTGKIILAGSEYNVIDVRKSGNAYVHILDGEVEPLIGETALAAVDAARRDAIKRNHSATHLVHEALRRVLGAHVKQAGSLVAPDHLRFDFPHFQKVGEEEIRDIEQMVNEKIRENIPVYTEEMTIETAQKIPGVKMFFGDKYGDRVRVVTMDEAYSKEFCGGTHVARTPEIGLFKIIAEGSIAAGTRRIEAITGTGVERFIDSLHRKILESQQQHDTLLEKMKSLEKELSKYKLERAQSELDVLVAKAVRWNDASIVIAKVEANDVEQLKALGDSLREKLRSGVGILAAIIDEKVQLVCVVTDDLVKGQGLKAGKIVGDVAKLLGGGGGGKPHLATAGGKDISKLDDALKQAMKIITGDTPQ